MKQDILKIGPRVNEGLHADIGVKYFSVFYNNILIDEEDAVLINHHESNYLIVHGSFSYELCKLPLAVVMKIAKSIQVNIITSPLSESTFDISFDRGKYILNGHINYDAENWNNFFSYNEYKEIFLDHFENVMPIQRKSEDFHIDLPMLTIDDISKPIEYYVFKLLNIIKEADAKALSILSKENNTIVKNIEFPPEYRQAGLAILNYFGRIVEQKYPEIDVKLRIEQEGVLIRLIIETPDGEKEKIEHALEDYALVLQRNLSPHTFLDNPLHILELQGRLDLLTLELRSAERLLEFSQTNNRSLENHNKSLEKRLDELTAIIHSSFAASDNLTNVLTGALSRRYLDEEVRNSLSRLVEIMENGITPSDRDQILEELRIIRNSNRSLFQDFVVASSAGGSGNLIAACIQGLIRSSGG